MDSREFGEWMAYYRICPFGEENLHSARLLAMLYNINRGKGKPELNAEKFMIGAAEKPQKVGDQILAAFGQHNAMAKK